MTDENTEDPGADDLSTETRPIVVQRKASELREAATRSERRRRWILLTAGIVVVVGLVAAFASAIAASRTSAELVPANMVNGGVVIGAHLAAGGVAADGVAVSGQQSPAASTLASAEEKSPAASTSEAPALSLTAYVDFDCVNCAGFMSANGTQLRGWVSSGRVSLTIVPVAYSGSQYSIVAANAAACVANFAPDSFFDFAAAMFTANPDGTLSRDSAQIAALAAKASGVSGGDLATCIDDQRYRAWVLAQVQNFSVRPSASGGDAEAAVPAIFVNGNRFDGNVSDPIEFATFLSHVESGTLSASPSPGSSASTAAAD